MNDEQFLRRAIALGRQGMEQGAGGPFGAVIVRDGQIIGEGFNQVTSTNDPTAHAEVVAIRDACRRASDFQLDDCIVYTSCEPCPMCLGAIYWSRAKRIVYAANRADAAAVDFDDDFIYREINIDPTQRSIPAEQQLAKEGTQLFGEWKEKTDKMHY